MTGWPRGCVCSYGAVHPDPTPDPATNGDGYGDLRGILEKLEYMVDSGINIIWLSPIFNSPMYDMG
jgi:glycosidase